MNQAMMTDVQAANGKFNAAEGLETDAFLVFELHDAHYAIAVQHVSEIITTIDVSPVPGAPPYLTGVVNLRGRILPIVDLRKRFGFAAPGEGISPCFIILSTTIDEKLVELGIQIDNVDEVVRIEPEQLDRSTSMHDYGEHLVFEGVAKTEKGIRLLVDVRALIEELKADVREEYNQ